MWRRGGLPGKLQIGRGLPQAAARGSGGGGLPGELRRGHDPLRRASDRGSCRGGLPGKLRRGHGSLGPPASWGPRERPPRRTAAVVTGNTKGVDRLLVHLESKERPEIQQDMDSYQVLHAAKADIHTTTNFSLEDQQNNITTVPPTTQTALSTNNYKSLAGLNYPKYNIRLYLWLDRINTATASHGGRLPHAAAVRRHHAGRSSPPHRRRSSPPPMSRDQTETIQAGGIEPDPMDSSIRHDSEVVLGSNTDAPLFLAEASSHIPQVDWDNLNIVETHDEEGRIEPMSEDQLYAILGLRHEDERRKAAKPNSRTMREQGDDNTEGAAIPISDAIPDEVVITYDKDHPKMDLGTLYPSMDEFRLAVRQFAINEEFELGTEKSAKDRFRGFCKSSEECPWRIVGRRQADEKK